LGARLTTQYNLVVAIRVFSQGESKVTLPVTLPEVWLHKISISVIVPYHPVHRCVYADLSIVKKNIFLTGSSETVTKNDVIAQINGIHKNPLYRETVMS